MRELALVAGLLGLLGWMFAMDRDDKQRLAAFHSRCTAQGGVVLNSTHPGKVKWTGCYSGVKELPNEG